MKRDPTVFTDLKCDEDFGAWNNNTMLQAATQGAENVLDPNCKPSDQEEKELFVEQQKCMINEERSW